MEKKAEQAILVLVNVLLERVEKRDGRSRKKTRSKPSSYSLMFFWSGWKSGMVDYRVPLGG
jgi:hypothetical protein